MKGALRLTLVLLAVASVSSESRAGTSFIYPGQLCQWYAGTNPQLQYDNFGLFNTMSGPGTKGAVCPITVSAVLGNPLVIESVTVNFGDNSHTDSVSCTVEEINWEGSAHWSVTKSSCSTWGGCPYGAKPGYGGMGMLVFNDPIPAGNQYPISMSVMCLVPSGSRIFGYNATVH